MIDHVNNLKLQHLVELSKLGDRCVGIELNRAVAGRARRRLRQPHPVRADAALRLPGQVRRVRRAVECLSAVLNRFCDAYPDDARLREGSRCRTSRCPRPPRPTTRGRFGSAGSTPSCPATRSSSLSSTPTRRPGIGYTDVLHEGLREAIDLPRVEAEFDTAYTPSPDPHRHAARCLPIAAPPACSSRAPPPRARRPARQPVRAGVPDHLRCRDAVRDRGFHATTDELAYDGSALRVGGEPVELVYRRALIEDLEEGDLTAALRDGTVCVVNHPRARVATTRSCSRCSTTRASRTSSSRARPR